QLGHEADRVTALPQARAELDVLDRRLRIARGVEAARIHEDRLVDRPATAPERFRLARALAVVVVVDEILVLRQKVFRRRTIVVAAEDCGGASTFEGRGKNARGVFTDNHIRIDEPDHVAACSRSAAVARSAGTRAYA